MYSKAFKIVGACNAHGLLMDIVYGLHGQDMVNKSNR